MLITAIRKTSADRLSITLEDGTEIKSTLGVVTELRLFSGRDIDEEALNELRLLSVRSLARDRAIEYISRRRMSSSELYRKLCDKGEAEETAQYCVDWLTDKGFLNDESYAAAVARHYSAKGYGAGRIRSELHRRGVERGLWDNAVEQMYDNSDKIDKFIASRLKDPDDRDQLRKVSAALYRRGFSWEEIRSALKRFNAQTEDLE